MFVINEEPKESKIGLTKRVETFSKTVLNMGFMN
jgi:hypothetical protein